MVLADETCRVVQCVVPVLVPPYTIISFLESIASLMVIFLVEVLILAELKNINPYGQPAVEDIKVKTLNRLNK